MEKYNTGPGMTWDEWFHTMCVSVATKSQCLSRQIGAVLVKDRSIISTGYNGPPRGVPHCGHRHKLDPDLMADYEAKGLDKEDVGNKTAEKCPRYILGYKSGEGLELCVAGHAERNALINAARAGIKTKKCTLYMDCGVPCTPCLVEIINAGIKEIVVTKMTYYDRSSEYLLKNSSLLCRVYDHLKEEENE